MPKKVKTKLTKHYILDVLKLNFPDLRKYGVVKIGLFGSYLHGVQKKTSDLDFLVELGKPTFDNYSDLKFRLERMFHKKVDLVIEKNLKPALSHVRQEAVYVKAK